MEVLDLDAVAQLLHISPATARRRVSRGELMPPSFRIGRRRLFLKDAVVDWLNLQLTAQKDIAPRKGRRRADH